MSSARICELVIGGSRANWAQVGINFSHDGVFAIGEIVLRIDESLSPGLHSWALSNVDSTISSIDGIPTTEVLVNTRSAEIKSHIAEELNILTLDDIHVAGTDLVDISVKANFRTLGEKFGADVQVIAKTIAATDHNLLVKDLRKNESHTLVVNLSSGDKSAKITLDDLVITETPRSGWSVASHAGENLALDLTLTPELINAGLVREVIRAIQEERKNIGLDISDRITVNWNAPSATASAISAAVDEISAEVLATSMVQVKSENNSSNELGLWLNLIKN